MNRHENKPLRHAWLLNPVAGKHINFEGDCYQVVHVGRPAPGCNRLLRQTQIKFISRGHKTFKSLEKLDHEYAKQQDADAIEANQSKRDS